MPSEKTNSFAQVLSRHGSRDEAAEDSKPAPSAPATPTADAEPAASGDSPDGGDRRSSGKSKRVGKRSSVSGRRRGTKQTKSATAEPSGSRGGRRSDPNYTHVTVLLPKDLIKRLKLAKVVQERDMSEIVEEALERVLPPE